MVQGMENIHTPYHSSLSLARRLLPNPWSRPSYQPADLVRALRPRSGQAPRVGGSPQADIRPLQ